MSTGSQAFLFECTLSSNTEVGLFVGAAMTMLERCEIDDNPWGVLLAESYDASPHLWMDHCAVTRSSGTGVGLLSSVCFDPEAPEEATALVSGERNTVPGPEEDDGNATPLCPDASDPLWPEGFLGH